MCGIAGLALADHTGRVEPALLKRMTDAIVHRGPDDDGTFVHGPVGLAFRRLSIIDLAGGHQPIANETGDVVVTLNGELYNYRELRAELEERGHRFSTNSDVEVVVHLWEEERELLLQRLVGMFALALVDLRGPVPELFLARDRLGIKPLYWTPEALPGQPGIAWASEPKALLARENARRELRPEALLDYLVQGYTGGSDAAWHGMHRLPPGHFLTYTPGGVPRTTRYWDLPTDGLREPAPADEILEWLDRVVRDRLVADVPLGAFLSGGIDSTAVADSMHRADPDELVLCSIGFRERSHDELETARATAARLGAVHHTRVLDPDPALALDVLPWFYDEPLADPSTLPTYLVSQVAREHVTVALSGDGGDETFAGYRRYVHDRAENRLRRRLGAPGRALAGTLGAVYPKLDWAPRWLRGKTFLSNLAADPVAAYFQSVSALDRTSALALLEPDIRARLSSHDSLDAFRDHYERPTVDDPLYRAQYADFHTYLPDQILAKVDRASMAVSLEVRVPILDHRFVGRFANLPADEKVRAGRGKHALREALRSRLPGDVLDGAKRGFDTPLKSWIRGPLAAPVANALRALSADWFDGAALERVRAEHASGRRDHGRLLWSLLVLEAWRRRHAVRGLSA